MPFTDRALSLVRHEYAKTCESFRRRKVHRFASRIHLHNTGLGCEQRMRRAFFRSTLLALPSVHCSPRCPSIAAVHLRPSLRCADALASTGLGCDRRVCEAQLVKITGQTKNMKKTVLVQNEALEWGATCFPRKAFRLNAGTKHPQTVQNVEFVIISYLYWFRHLWYIIEVFPIRNVTQQGALARNCPSKAVQARLHPDIKT